MKRPGPKPKTARNAKILRLRGKLSCSLIGEQLGVSIGAVSGVCFRADYPLLVRHRKTGTSNRIGTGRHGPGFYARRTRSCGGARKADQ